MWCARAPALALTSAATLAVVTSAMSASGAAAAERCSTPAPEFAELLAERWTSALAAGQTAALLALYARGAAILSPASDRPIANPVGVERHVARFAVTFRSGGRPQRTLRVGCDSILEFGTMTLEAWRNGRSRAFPVRYSRVFERRGSGWMITLEHLSRFDEIGAQTAAASRAPARAAQSALRAPVRPNDDRTPRRAMTALVKDVQRQPLPEPVGVLQSPPRLVRGPAQRTVSGPRRDSARMSLRPPSAARAPSARRTQAKRRPRPVRVQRKRDVDRGNGAWARGLPGFENFSAQ